ncbi:MAG: alpha-hydroxy-acid oxidizing protein [Bacteroidia bacterium]|nr:alpha-hydroxy-acid oxidizing protein [Bacteroidia bacterium]
MRNTLFTAPDVQRGIYVNGLAGIRPLIPTDPDALEAAARRRMSPEAYAYIAGGAGTGLTMTANRRGFDPHQLVPRMLRDVSVRDYSTSLLGMNLPLPLLLAPIGVLEMVHPAGDLPVARAAASLGIPMIFSNQASVPMETCAAEMGDSPRWFQLYWSKSDELVVSLVQRAERAGCRAIVVTLDTTLLGWRTRDLDLGYLPFLQGRGIAQYVADPVFRRLMEQPEPALPGRNVTFQAIRALIGLTRRFPGSFWGNLRSGAPLTAVRKFISLYSRPSLTWDDLAFLRAHTRLPVLLKGILHPDDARRALDAGMDGIIVSNHGGRQVDGALGAIEALPGVVAAVAGRVPVLMDSGIRTGADMLKALALGASAVCLGRPYVYALALAGQAGVVAALQHLAADFELAMALTGCAGIREISPDLLHRRAGQ